ncbi:phosphatidate cytidylyltransferase [Halomonas sp. MCCC 1A17488]|uniref:Phosphatidate cytidylyltransferase n=1 Tax=Billgrantia sulfidoxydans TaxID=2733484 RepID=A0ABX7W3R3_9GAMM|nr:MULTISPECIES: phosphatidate cytidylyltransferase [Halomonas]MCE8016744.1 phosphatidate cytidylyltransferase [Halomonas sp. MCCC 1A17488]MCG3240077.1 phosphatidate cytidylyltransferase [Halomonas sp. MCCC 1A17488]QPP50041.1 phosphatidate cytidylyltransferase [Halomonas sp. SS10-MC5]QTP53653.1 phosphatidate cytidylyltransferase [Halomonas sulfidoxydans]
MLRQRIVTAAWLAPLMLAGLFGLSGGPFAAFTGLVVLLAAWEWTNLAGVAETSRRLTLVGVLAVLMTLLWWLGAALAVWPLWLAVAGWAINFYWVVHYPAKREQWGSTAARLAMGLWVLLPAWVGFNVLRDSGGVWLLYVLLLVWGADIGAYFCGRAWGRRKLAPGVSPGKSWEGVAGGVAVTLLLALLFAVWQGLGVAAGLGLMVVTAGVTLVSVLGDLLESMLKRFRGIKDSSNLLPGHGGVLDRIDSLTAAVPLFALLSTGML